MFKNLLSLICMLMLPVAGYFLVSCETAGGDVSTELGITLVGNGAFCDEFFDDNHSFTMTVTVDKVVDANTGQLELHDVDIMTVDNDFFGESFALNIPETGGFAITVQLTSTQCMDCCSIECSFPSTGRPLLRDMRTFNGDPGGIINMELDILACNCC